MAQLIKLQDYISRYEQDVYRYPSRFVRLKKQQWEKLLNQFNNEGLFDEDLLTTEDNEQDSKGILSRITSLFKRDHQGTEGYEYDLNENEESDEVFELYQEKPVTKIKNTGELKQYFLDNLFNLQLKWASSTIKSVSFPDPKYTFDKNLKYFLQRFPDNVLVLYKPIFLIKKAPFESETLLVTPTAIWCVSFLEDEDNAVFVGTKEHFWTKKGTSKEKKILNPIMGVDRTEKVIKDMLAKQEVSFPIKKAIVCRNGYIDYPSAPNGVELLEKRNYLDWFEKMRSERAPIKSEQLKVTKIILDSVQSIYSNRVEWNQDE